MCPIPMYSNTGSESELIKTSGYKFNTALLRLFAGSYMVHMLIVDVQSITCQCLFMQSNGGGGNA